MTFTKLSASLHRHAGTTRSSGTAGSKGNAGSPRSAAPIRPDQAHGPSREKSLISVVQYDELYLTSFVFNGTAKPRLFADFSNERNLQII